jgi:acyl-CoA thioesterase FadM
MLATVWRRFSKAHVSTKALGAQSLFLPAVTTTRTPLMECDSNGHKGNSSYLTDLDISRSNLCNLLFGQALNMGPGPMSGRYFLALGGVACTFKREIMPYQRYQVWSRLLSWDEKWLYIVSHFVDAGSHHAQEETSSANSDSSQQDSTDGKSPKERQGPGKSSNRRVFASAISRCVFKKGRITVAPEDALRSCGLLCGPSIGLPDRKSSTSRRMTQSRDEILEQEQSKCDALENKDSGDWEKLRMKNLSVARLEEGWDRIHALFYDSDQAPMETCLDIPCW